MSTAMPQIPPRPTRAQAQDQPPATKTGSSLGNDIPRIPPRPINRRLERSVSPQRESYARSPLNETPVLANHGNQSKTSLYITGSANNSSADLPRRPSSVALPSIGQEGNEYAEVFGATEELGTSPTQTRNVANDLKLHAPKPSLPISSAKQRVSTVTRTDSGQAAAFGIGKASSNDDKDPSCRPLKSKPSFASQTSNGTERPPSSMESDHGIPEIGQRVPMYPDAGDVQAPSPAPFAQPYAPGIGFHNDGSKARHHGRRTSARGFEGPPDSYGLHGHGIIPHDRFEKAYYEKHPEIFKKEVNHRYQEERADWALSSEDLNKIVRDTASRGAGPGTSPAIFGTPSEQIGFQASEEYASRISSPRPGSGYQQAHANTSQTHVDSPLRKESFPAEAAGKAEFENNLSSNLYAPSDTALESEVEDEDTIHVDTERRINKIYGGFGRLESTEDLGPNTGHGGEEDGIHDEHGYGAPILASDEVAKEPFGWELQPAVSPMNERRASYYDESGYHHRSGSQSSFSNSRPTSRPGSIHGNVPGLRVGNESTPLEDLEEYEPLFPEEEKTGQAIKKPLTVADRFKRPELKNRKFPSQDVWEDTPNSLQFTATVSTPQLPEDSEEGTMDLQTRESETLEEAFATKQEELAEQESTDTESFLHNEKKPWAHKTHLSAETTPGMKQRFPSRDIWEDTPDSLQLETTVAAPQSEDKDILSPPEERPTTGAVVYHQEKAAAGLHLGPDEGRATTGIATILKPQIPARPARSKPADFQEKTQPAIPERPQRSRQIPLVEGALGTSPPLPLKSKPAVPARPSKPITRESSEIVPLSQVPSNSSAKSFSSDQGSIAAAKPKPPVPSRPVGSKIAALQGGFLSDLNKRLQLGPQAPKKEEPAPEAQMEEKTPAPLADARKGRARGPARRAPAKSPAPGVEAVVEKSTACAFSTPYTLWEIDPEEDLLHVSSHLDEIKPHVSNKATESETPVLAINMAGESVRDSAEIFPEAGKSGPAPSAVEDVQAEQIGEGRKEVLSSEAHDSVQQLEPIKSSDSPPFVSQSTLPPAAAEDEDTAGSTATHEARTEKVGE